MTEFSYAAAAAGGWLALADGERMLAIAPDGYGRAGEAWIALRSARGFESVIDLLMRGGFAAMPDFVLLEWRADTVRTLLRGPASIEVTDAAGRHAQDGAGISTWTERTFSAVTSVEVSIVGGEPAPGLAALPLRSGAAVIAGATITIRGVASGSAGYDEESARKPAPATEPAPAIEPASAIEPAPATESAPATEPAPVPARGDAPDGTVVSDQTIVPDTTVTAPPAPLPSEPDESTIVRPRRAPAALPTPASPAASVPAITVQAPAALTPAALTPAPLTPAAPTPAASTSAAPTSAAPGRASASPTSPPLITAPPTGDHDGETVLTSDVQKLRAGRGAVPSVAPPEREPAASVPVLTLADGSVEPLDRAVIVGRAPSLSKVSGERMPRLVALGEGDHDISRNHVRLAVEGGTVVVTDLHSRNGTVVVLPGRSPQKLRAGEPTAVIAGTLVDLGGGVTFTVSEP